MTVEEQAKAINDNIDLLKTQLETAATKDQVTALTTQIKDLNEAVNLVKEAQLNPAMPENVRTQLHKLVKENHADIVDAIKNKKTLEFEFKAPAVHLNTNTVTNAVGVSLPIVENYEIDNDIAVIRYPENFILNVISNRQVNKVPQTIIRNEETTKEGAVAVVAEGGVKPLVQYKFVRTLTTRDKYAGRIEWSEEFEMDNEALFRAIVEMLERDVVRAWQAGMLSKIIANATAYVSSSLDGTLVAPDNGLAIVATQSQLQALNFTPDTVVMNPSDMVSTIFAQNADGDLKVSPYINATAGTINGMRLIQTNLMTAGTALVFDSKIYREIHSQYIMRTGQYADQFIENEYTMIGEVFSILTVAEREKIGAVLVNLATVKTALLKEAAE